MTDTASAPAGTIHDWASDAARKRVKRRYAADRRLQAYGIAAIGTALLLLGVLFTSLIHAGYVAFWTTKVVLDVKLDASKIDKDDPASANFRAMTRDAFFNYFPDVDGRSEKRRLTKLISSGAPYIVRDYVVENPDEIGSTAKIPVPLSDPFDQLHKGVIPREINALSPDRIALFQGLDRQGVVLIEDNKAFVRVDAYIDPAKVDTPADSTTAEVDKTAADYETIAQEAVASYFPRARNTAYMEMIAGEQAQEVIKSRIEEDPSLVGKTISVKLPLSQNYSNLAVVGEAKIRNPRFSSDQELQWFDSLVERGLITTPFTWELFTNADSRFPELAGLAGALSGSFFALLVCFLLGFPIGIATALYLEEFAPKHKWTDLVEVNINNQAAVPSVVFGLLGLAVFLNAFGLPRSAPLVGGMVLSLMTLPTIIVATRAALKAVPPSIREAALGIGASKHQVMTHHVLPLAMPGILTGTIIGFAQALGETAPLLLIGMNAFIPSIENVGLLQPAMALPTQIFSWADSPERGFVSRTSAAILVLLGFLILMNLAAVILRRKMERQW